MREKMKSPLQNLDKAPHHLSWGYFSRFFLLHATLFWYTLGLCYLEKFCVFQIWTWAWPPLEATPARCPPAHLMFHASLSEAQGFLVPWNPDCSSASASWLCSHYLSIWCRLHPILIFARKGTVSLWCQWIIQHIIQLHACLHECLYAVRCMFICCKNTAYNT